MRTSIIFFCLLLGACIKEGRKLFLQADVISSEQNTLPSKSLARGELVQASWCGGEKSYLSEERAKKSGAMEQVLAKASKLHETDYFVDVSFYTQMNCLFFRGFLPK